MNAHSPRIAIWQEYSLGHFNVKVAPNATYGVHADGNQFLAVIPNGGIRKCRSRGHVERVLFDAYDQMMAMDEVEDDDESADRAYAAHIRDQRTLSTFPTYPRRGSL